MASHSPVVGSQLGRPGADAGSVSGTTDAGSGLDSTLIRLQRRNGFLTVFHALLKKAWILLLLLPRVGISSLKKNKEESISPHTVSDHRLNIKRCLFSAC